MSVKTCDAKCARLPTLYAVHSYLNSSVKSQTRTKPGRYERPLFQLWSIEKRNVPRSDAKTFSTQKPVELLTTTRLWMLSWRHHIPPLLVLAVLVGEASTISTLTVAGSMVV